MKLERSNNLGLIKFLAAIAVIIHHSFALTCHEQDAWMDVLTRGQLGFGGLAVAIFFFFSGLLVTKSLMKKPEAKSYFIQRAKRIMPALAIVVVISAFIMGPIVSTLGAKEYFFSGGTYKYLLNAVFVPVHELPGVFENNAAMATVNGALWTLPVEVACYIGVFILYKLKLLTKKVLTVMAVPLYALWVGVLIYNNSFYISVYRAGLMFFAGMLVYAYKDDIRLSKLWAVIGFVVLGVLSVVGFLQYAFVIILPYILLVLCWNIKQVPEAIGKVGNVSYSIYLCGFPIQQIIVHLVGGIMSPYDNMLFAVPISIVFGIVLWAVGERPFAKKNSPKRI
ncbi:MAG: acyltransferase [Lachnospiraceae bacterium]|nr:acyltransferase [Lachnospiraceae bacterium]